MMNRTPKIIAVAGGKGGVGKTWFAAMLGICLAGFKRRTILVDLDFSGANLQGYLGIHDQTRSLNEFIAGRSTHLADYVQQTCFKELDAITFRSDATDYTIKPWQKRRLFREIKHLKADYIILDLGAASTDFGIDTFLYADSGVILSTSDMFSVLNTYTFIRSALLRGLRRYFYDSPEVLVALNECGILVDGKMVKPLHSILQQFESDRTTQVKLSMLQQFWKNFQPKIVLNFAKDGDPLNDFILLGPVVRDLLDVQLDYWGRVRADMSVRTAILEKRPEKFFSPLSRASEDMVKLTVRNLIAKEFDTSDTQPARWLDNHVAVDDFVDFFDSMQCQPKCLLWNSCDCRAEGRPCSRLNIQQLRKAG